jgi:hypothetical protein
MKFINKLKKNLIQKYENYKKIASLINIPFLLGIIIFFIISLFIAISTKNLNFILNIFIGFLIAFVFYADMGLYVSKHIEIKNLNPVMLIINLIKNLLLITFFFIITYKLINYNYVGVSIGFTIMPLSVFLALVLRLINND